MVFLVKYKQKETDELCQEVSTAVRDTLNKLEYEKSIVVENLCVSIRYARGRRSVICDVRGSNA